MSIHQPEGFVASGIHCGLKPDKRKDVALIVSQYPCYVAGVFTTNRVKAAPVLYDQEIIRQGKPVRAVVANAGNANACTGQQGMTNVRTMAEHTAQALGCQPDEILVLSTGVIGVQLPMDTILPGIDAAAAALSPDGWQDAAEAIMTTDTRPKITSVREEGYTILGIAKGAGMIAPNMATMLSVMATDGALQAGSLDMLFRETVGASFNRIVVDGDMSTNDTVLLLANSLSGPAANFGATLKTVGVDLARAIVRDGEGATKLVTIQVENAANTDDARAVARAIATSSLCKTAFYGADPNWGRIICAAGYSGVELDPQRLRLWLEDIQLVEAGQPVSYDEQAAIAVMTGAEWTIRLDLGMGESSWQVWTCDLSHEYVTINGHYRT